MITPRIESPEIKAFCADICAGIPIYVEPRPKPKLEQNNCVENVIGVVKEFGGSLVIGWMIVIWPEVYIEAHPHAVWRSPQWGMIDPTPHSQRYERIAFLPDPSLSTDQLNQIRAKAIHPEVSIQDFVRSHDMLTRAETQIEQQQLFGRMRAILETLESRFGPEPFPP